MKHCWRPCHVSTKYISFTFPQYFKDCSETRLIPQQSGFDEPPCSLLRLAFMYYARGFIISFTKFFLRIDKLSRMKHINNWDWINLSQYQLTEKYKLSLFCSQTCIHHHEFYHILLLEDIAECDLVCVHPDHPGTLRSIVCWLERTLQTLNTRSKETCFECRNKNKGMAPESFLMTSDLDPSSGVEYFPSSRSHCCPSLSWTS